MSDFSFDTIFSKEEIEEFKKTNYETNKDMNRVVYWNIMRLNNDRNWTGRKERIDFDRLINWSCIIYDKEETLNSKNKYMLYSQFFNEYIRKRYSMDYDFFNLMIILDMYLTKLYDSDKVYIITDYYMKNSFKLSSYFGDKTTTDIFNEVLESKSYSVRECIDWSDIYGNDYDMKDNVLNYYLEDRTWNDRIYWVMKLGKLNDFVSKDWESKVVF